MPRGWGLGLCTVHLQSPIPPPLGAPGLAQHLYPCPPAGAWHKYGRRLGIKVRRAHTQRGLKAGHGDSHHSPRLATPHHAQWATQQEQASCLPAIQVASMSWSLQYPWGLPVYSGVRQLAHEIGRYLARLLSPWPAVSPAARKREVSAIHKPSTPNHKREGASYPWGSALAPWVSLAKRAHH